MDLNQRNTSIIRTMFDKQPYDTEVDGIAITIDKGVFPSDLGLTTKYLIDAAKKYKPTTALDMGCGPGVIAIALKRMGVPEVWAADIHEPAVACTKNNAARYPQYGSVEIVQSDLFENIPGDKKFDLIIFNHPYAPTKSGNGRFGGNGKGGREVIARFFEQAATHMNADTKILMPYSEIAGSEHSPEVVSHDFDLVVKNIFEATDAENGRHIIYEFSKE